MTPAIVDRCISAEIPDINVDPELHALVIKHMVHGPCGPLNPSAPCMKNGVCSKRYPFDFKAVSNLTCSLPVSIDSLISNANYFDDQRFLGLSIFQKFITFSTHSPQTTNLTEGSFAVMRRRSPSQGGFTAEKIITMGGFQTVITIDNRWIVPYCPFLLRQFECHMNVEICSTVTSIKYVLKYTFKGQDRAAFNLESGDTPVDEISEYENNRYIS